MKMLIALVFLCFSSLAFGSGELVVGGYYLDDVDQSVSPKLGVAAHSGLLGGKWVDSLYAGVGYLNPANTLGISPWYEEFQADVSYSGLANGLSVSAGAGLIGNRAAYSSLSDHVHISVAYKLW